MKIGTKVWYYNGVEIKVGVIGKDHGVHDVELDDEKTVCTGILLYINP